MIKISVQLLLVLMIFTGCKEGEKQKKSIKKVKITTINSDAQKVRDYMNKNVVIAHRGSTFWTPEETEPAFLWARNIGADYLEFDVQLTKDNQLVAFHDKNLSRTTNVSEVFPGRIKSVVNEFTLKELRRLDAGSWFNTTNPERAKKGFIGIKIMTLQDVIMIAEGYRIKAKNGKPVKEMVDGKWNGKYLYEIDPNDNGNRPGIYVETKNPKPGTEKILHQEITEYGWNINSNSKEIKTSEGKVGIANTNARFVIQSFSLESIQDLEKYLPNIPKCLLLWQPNMVEDIKGNYKKAIDFCIANNVHSMGTSIAGEPNNYKELTAPWMAEMIHNAGMVIHPYTFDTNKQLTEYKDRVEGVFTNRADLALAFYGRESTTSSKEILIELGYK